MNILKTTQLSFLGLALVFSACGNKEKKADEQDVKVTETPIYKNTGLKIGFYYVDSLNANYEFIKVATKSVDTKVSQITNAFQSKVNNLQNWANTQNDKAQKGLLLSTEIEKFQQEYQEKQYNLGQEQQQIQEQIQQIQNESLVVALNRVEDFMNRFAKENGYDLILQYSKGGQVSFANPEMNITADVVRGLNKEYAESNGSENTGK